MNRLEKAKWSALLALSDATGDMDEYYLYFLIPLTQYGCDGTDFVLGTVLIAMEVVSLINNPLSGWIVDFTEAYQHLTLILSAIMQLVTAAIFIFIGPRMNIVSLVAVMLAHALFVILTQTSMWKCVKMRCQLLYGDSEDEQETTMSLIGTHQHIWSNAYELIFLGGAFAVMHFMGNGSFKWAQIIIYASVLLADVAIILMAGLTIQWSALQPAPAPDPHAVTKKLLGKPRRDGEDDTGDEETACLIPAPAPGRNVNNSDEKLPDAEEVEVEVDWRELSAAEIMSRVFWATLRGVKEKVLAFYYCRLAVHAILQAWLLYVFTEVMEYPLAFAEASKDGPDCQLPQSHCDPDNYCAHNLTNLVEVSMLEVVTYVIGAIGYFVFLLPMPPKWFYWLLLPGISVTMVGLTLSFWFLEHVPHTVSFIFLSIGLVVPTFLERYNFYFWLSVIESKHFGFFYGLYGVGKNVLHIVVSLVLALFGKQIKPLSWEFNLLLCICMGMMAFSFFYSLLFAWLYSDYFKQRADKKADSAAAGSPKLSSSTSSSSFGGDSADLGDPSSDAVEDTDTRPDEEAQPQRVPNGDSARPLLQGQHEEDDVVIRRRSTPSDTQASA